MSSSRIVWIDDEPKRLPTAQDLGANFVNVHGADLAQIIDELLEGLQPGLVLVDHVLDKVGGKTPSVFKKGSTIAEALKERWPSCPVVGVTNIGNLATIDDRTQKTYDELFPFTNFAKYFDRIKGIAKGFASVARVASDAAALVRLLKPPVDERERLLAALPRNLKSAAQDESRPSRMYRWVAHLLDRPGFLLDKLWSATVLGINEVGFKKVDNKFKRARYTGIFARPDEPRWWSSRLSDLLYKECRPQSGELSWQTGRRLGGISARQLSRCYYCDEEYPETVALLDEESEERHPMHLKCTKLHPEYKRELYFEDIRMMTEKR